MDKQYPEGTRYRTKDLVKNCHSQCKSINNKECFDVCFEKYLRTVARVNETLKKMGYEKHSLFAYKGYPEHTIDTLFYHDEYMFKKSKNFTMGVTHEKAI